MNTAQAKPIPTTQPVHENLKDMVLLGDCVQIMRSIAPGCADFVLTDPPYLVRYCDRSGRRIPNPERMSLH